MNGPIRDRGAESDHSSSARGSEPVQVLLVDDHELFRTGLRELLEREGVAVVGMAPDGETALSFVADQPPDIVLMDLDLPGLSGVETTRRIATSAPLTRVLVLTISADEQSVVDAIAAGACGYLLKGASLESLVAGIKAGAAGESVISPGIAAKLFERLRIGDGSPSPEAAALSQLSEREIEILKLVAGGMRNAQIAEELVISPNTVRNHVSNILAKLHMRSRLEVAAYAIRNRMV